MSLLRLLKNRIFKYNKQEGNLYVEFEYTDNRKYTNTINPGDLVRIVYQDSNLIESTITCIIKYFTYKQDELSSNNKKILKLHVRTSDYKDIEIKFVSIVDVFVITQSSLLNGEYISDNTIIVFKESDLQYRQENATYYLINDIVDGDLALDKGFYKYIEKQFINSKSQKYTEQPFKIFDSYEDMIKFAGYNGMIASCPIIKDVGTDRNTIIEGVKISNTDNLLDGFVLKINPITKSIISVDGNLYYRCNEDGTLCFNSVLLYDKTRTTETIFWFPTELKINSLEQNILTGICDSIQIYKYEDSWKEFKTGSSDGNNSTGQLSTAYESYTSMSAFPVIGVDGLFYLDSSTDKLYVYRTEKGKYVNITSNQSINVAGESLGLVKSDINDNKISVNSLGIMEVNSVTIDKLKGSEDIIVFNAGDSNC